MAFCNSIISNLESIQFLNYLKKKTLIQMKHNVIKSEEQNEQ